MMDSDTFHRGSEAAIAGSDPSQQGESADATAPGIRMIPIESIKVVNPRERNRKRFGQIVANISDIGLKRPITVRPSADGGYELVCGQGRLEAFRQLGEKTVPAIIRNISQDDSMLMSIVENIARKRPTSMDTVRRLAELRDRGYTQTEIGRKTGVAANYVSELLFLYDHGEERLVTAVESGSVPIGAAIIIARSSNGDVQRALLEAMEQKKLSAHELQRARNLADTRKAFGKTKARQLPRGSRAVTSDSVVRAFKREQERQRAVLRKAELCEKRLVFTVNALKLLLDDENFINLLRAEGLETVPEYLAQEIRRGEANG
jgi:ParB family chromosome partitioning protein